jgi:hypothetical protein
MALHILTDRHNVVGWWLVLNYMRTPPTHYCLEYIGRVAYTETHPKTTHHTHIVFAADMKTPCHM